MSSLRWPPEEPSVLLAAEVPPKTLHFQQTQSMPSPNLHGDLVSWLKMHTLTPDRPGVDIRHHCPGAAPVGAEPPHVGIEEESLHGAVGKDLKNLMPYGNPVTLGEELK